MAKSKTRNKKYVPRYAGKTSVLFKITANEIESMKTMTQRALFNLVNNTGDIYDWRDLVWRLAVGRDLAIKYFSEDEIGETCHEALRVAIQIYRDHETKTKDNWSIDATKARVFNEACDVADEMIAQVTRREYNAVHDAIAKLPISILSGQDISWTEYKIKYVKH